MAKVVYSGVSNKARKIKKIYVGISSKARKVKNAYIGVNNKARLCYSSINPISGDITTVGNVVTASNTTWIVAHIANNRAYLISQYVTERYVQFKYPFSECAAAIDVRTYENTLSSDFLDICDTVTVHGSTGKVFIPTLSHLQGSDSYDTTDFEKLHFSYFATNTKMGYTPSGVKKIYYLSTIEYGYGIYTYCINTKNRIVGGNNGDTGTYRACVCVNMNLL